MSCSHIIFFTSHSILCVHIIFLNSHSILCVHILYFNSHSILCVHIIFFNRYSILCVHIIFFNRYSILCVHIIFFTSHSILCVHIIFFTSHSILCVHIIFFNSHSILCFQWKATQRDIDWAPAARSRPAHRPCTPPRPPHHLLLLPGASHPLRPALTVSSPPSFDGPPRLAVDRPHQARTCRLLQWPWGRQLQGRRASCVSSPRRTQLPPSREGS